ncbi:PLP-dependent transferase [Leucogyrophana mollusca]|uniref:PLP-dependent transferase n=1 Tax=Leucogyrophana mollusca TaxID=85980 RepID=A0ACB8C0T6_9AGAM|nr:PLP-dependent transferase [Leucogyrophana mollusca]
MSLADLPDAIDLSHHLSVVARARRVSPLKSLQKYFGKSGIIQLGGGLPNPTYFPFVSLSAEVMVPESFTISPQPSSFEWLWKFLGKEVPYGKTTGISIPKYPTAPDDLNLARALQYTPAIAQPQLQAFMTRFVREVYQPAYANYAVLVNMGNTDGWNKALTTLCDPGSGVLVEEWTYASAMAAMIPCGVSPVPVRMDAQGMRDDSLRVVLEGWDEVQRGMSRPRVLYLVPVGQNPCGSTMTAERKRRIYDVCVDFDVVIVEDDPYYFLQMGAYVPREDRPSSSPLCGEEARYIASLVPSFLKYDYQGRVIRLDSFSKTIAPGSRLGWFTCHPVFAERLERQGETTTQAPCGFSQALVIKLLTEWRYEGYIRWLQGLGVEYRQRRDFFLDCLAEEFHLRITPASGGVWGGTDVYTATAKRGEKPGVMFSFVPPTAGMFVWMTLHVENHARFSAENQEPLEMELWTRLAEAGVLFCPGWMFAYDGFVDAPDGTVGSSNTPGGHFRVSFSNAELGDLRRAVEIFARVLGEFFAEE